MKKIWIYSILVSVALAILFSIFLFVGISTDNPAYLSISKMIINIVVVQFIGSIVFAIVKFKTQTYKTIFFILGIFIILCYQVFLYFGALSGLLG
ncbi:hypothetical protein ATE84_4005 [Aquimarina sp. MAR_2010_214]|uniref:hypothetical protein n=1 Tax=Aquimarina sp. MAR_2010_214 TaxID=1250026 RepID=UPI000C6FFC4E|nr:hypothetical protein [Aquimarina sp. MAR_2010_214]PKV51905.1 hypothetical protein ATE84_4005 [Aquimarina sp. MAR_2010_214]